MRVGAAIPVATTAPACQNRLPSQPPSSRAPADMQESSWLGVPQGIMPAGGKGLLYEKVENT